jgi:PKHD-type hydroxylase
MIYSIPPRSKLGKDYFAYCEGFLSNEEINLILAQPEWLNMQESVIGGNGGSPEINKEIRSNKVAWLGSKPEIQHIWEKLSNVVADINNAFFHFDLTGFYEPMQLGLYSESNQSHYSWHTDASPFDTNVPRKLSMVMLLSDASEFEGGQLKIKCESDNERILEMTKGKAWFFPSYMLHCVTPVTKGVRRSLVLWIGGPAFK